MKLLGIVSVRFDITDHLVIRFSTCLDTNAKREYNETVHQLLIDIQQVHDSVRTVLHNFSQSFAYPRN
jgi:hypothetical protein